MAKGKLATRRKKRGRKTRRRIKRANRQQGGSQPSDQDIHDLLGFFFPTLHRVVNKGHVRLSCDSEDNRSTDDPIYFEIMHDRIMLYWLKQCPGHSGTSILQRIIAIGRILSLHTIQLEDLSMVGCDYPLYTLSILRHGESWYHRMGFRSENHYNEKKVHDTIRTLSFEEFVPIMFRAYGEDTSTIFTKNERDAYLTQWYEAFPETRGFTVAQVAQMEEWRTISCDDPRSILLRNFLLMAKSALPYDSYLSLNLRRERV